VFHHEARGIRKVKQRRGAKLKTEFASFPLDSSNAFKLDLEPGLRNGNQPYGPLRGLDGHQDKDKGVALIPLVEYWLADVPGWRLEE
jgi:hypothetical protein